MAIDHVSTRMTIITILCGVGRMSGESDRKPNQAVETHLMEV